MHKEQDESPVPNIKKGKVDNMKERIIATVLEEAEEIIKNTESFILKYDPIEQREKKMWETAYDEITGIILVTMSLLNCEIEDYPITRLQELQEITEKAKAQKN